MGKSFSKSYEIFEMSKQRIPAGADSTMKAMPYQIPLYIKEASGVKIIDYDDNEIIDLNMAYGPLIFGHNVPFISNAVVAEIKNRGTMPGFPHELSFGAAELISKSFPSIDMMRFSSSGTEVVQTAIRLAKAYTRRDLIVVFEGHYHGSSDNVFHKYHASVSELKQNIQIIPGTHGMAGAPFNTVVLEWNNIDIVKEFLRVHGEKVAAFIMEPVMGNASVIKPNNEYLKSIRELTNKYGIILIFDEIITGFRIARGGAQEYFGVRADITTLSKAMSAGVPVSAIGGSEEIMRLLSDGTVFHGGVYSGNPMCLTATLETQKYIDKNHTQIYTELDKTSNRFVNGIRNIFSRFGIPVVVQNVGAMVSFTFVKENTVETVNNYREISENSLPKRYISFQNKVQNMGVYFHPNQYEPMYLSTAHTEDVVDSVLCVFEDVAKNF